MGTYKKIEVMIKKKKTQTGKRTEQAGQIIIVAGFAGSGKSTIGKEISRKLGYCYLDKDTVAGKFTESILESSGMREGDRESKLYTDKINALEYEALLDICMENVYLGNNVVLSCPFIQQIKDYNFIEARLAGSEREVDIRVAWIRHNLNTEYIRIKSRGCVRDEYKLKNWLEYSKSTLYLVFDRRYNVYEFRNSGIDTKKKIKKLIKWIKH